MIRMTGPAGRRGRIFVLRKQRLVGSKGVDFLLGFFGQSDGLWEDGCECDRHDDDIAQRAGSHDLVGSHS